MMDHKEEPKLQQEKIHEEPKLEEQGYYQVKLEEDLERGNTEYQSPERQESQFRKTQQWLNIVSTSTPFFMAHCKKQQQNEPILTSYSAAKFMNEAASHFDKSQAIDALSSVEGLKATRKVMALLTCSDASHMQAILAFLKFLTSNELSVGLKRKRALSVGAIVLDSPKFLVELLDDMDVLLERELSHVALFVLRVLDGTEDEERKTRPHVERLLEILKSHRDDAVRYVVVNRDLSLSSEELDHLQTRLHDNDFPWNYKNIQIFPTVQELTTATDGIASVYRGWLGDPADTHSALLDRQFRLLREDFVGPLRDEIAQFSRGKGDINGGNCLWNPRARGVVNDPWCTRGSCLKVTVDLTFGVQSLLKTMKTRREISKFLESKTGSLILPRDSVLLFFDHDDQLSSVGIVALRDTRAMAREIGGNLPEEEEEFIEYHEEPNNPREISVGLWFAPTQLVNIVEYDKWDKPFATKCVVSQFSFFSYEPILEKLQSQNTVMFEEELVSDRPSVVAAPTLNNIPEDAQRCLDKLSGDSSQLDAANKALSQRVTLIQGPPGTGKTFVGVNIVLALLKSDPDLRVMTLCYTNHALDSFLESIVAAGVSKELVARLGSGHSVSDDMRDCIFNCNTGRRQHEDKFWCSKIYSLIEDLQDKELSVAYWHSLSERLSRIDPNLKNTLRQFETNSRRDFSVVGRRGRVLRHDEGWTMWCEGLPQPHWATVPEGVDNLWALSKSERESLRSEWSQTLRVLAPRELVAALKDHNRETLKSMQDKAPRVPPQHRVLGATMSFAAKHRSVIDALKADVLIVEEAAEILEAHVLTNLSPSLSRLVLIGDHKQLRPKLEHFPLSVESGQGAGLDVSLFERLVVAGFPHSTLSVQHRMRPEISCFIRGTYPTLLDHESTTQREPVRGVASSVAFIHHTHAEDGDRDSESGSAVFVDTTSSKTNAHEVEMVIKMLRYLLQHGYAGEDIVVLTPCLGQLRAIRAAMWREEGQFVAKLSELDAHDLQRETDRLAALAVEAKTDDDPKNAVKERTAAQIRVATIDNFQGEEAKIVIASLVRSNARGEIGFVSGAERVNVLFSRARDGFFLLGNAETLENARSTRGRALWRDTLQRLRENRQFFEGFPAQCEVHGTLQVLASPRDFDTHSADGGCELPCGALFSRCALQHACPKKCHPRSMHHDIPCPALVEELCSRDLHTSRRLCHREATACCVSRMLYCLPVGHACYVDCHKDVLEQCPSCIRIEEERIQQEEERQNELDKEREETLRLEQQLAYELKKTRESEIDTESERLLHSEKYFVVEDPSVNERALGREEIFIISERSPAIDYRNGFERSLVGEGRRVSERWLAREERRPVSERRSFRERDFSNAVRTRDPEAMRETLAMRGILSTRDVFSTRESWSPRESNSARDALKGKDDLSTRKTRWK